MAIGCISYFKQQSYNLPDEISVVGFDNIESSTIITPNLTTIMQASIEKGEIAAKTLFKLIDGENLETLHKILPHKLILRDSLKNISWGNYEFTNKKQRYSTTHNITS